MGRYDNAKRNQYNSTPRKVFDAYIDKMALRRDRDREDYRADLQFLTNQIKRQQLQIDEIVDHVQSHCHVLNEDRKPFLTDVSEELE